MTSNKNVLIECTMMVLVFLFTFDHNAAKTPYDDRIPYCYRFTWIGPSYNNNSIFLEATCDDIIGEKGTVPCTQPLVVSDNGQAPNTTSIWDSHTSNVVDIACRLTPSDVCVKYTYKYNNAVENITYMCGKVSIQDGGVVRSSCYKEFLNGREIEVCVCESSAGERPCNAAMTYGGRLQWRPLTVAVLGLIGWWRRACTI